MKFFSAVLIVLLSCASYANAINHGDACTTLGNASIDGSNLFVCDGSNWIETRNSDSSGRTLFQVNNDTGACNSDKVGRMRYDDSGDTWSYCDGSTWNPFEQAAGGGGYSGPAYESHETAGSGGTATLTLNKPTNTLQDDLMLAFISRDGSGSAMSGPAGWTTLAEANVGAATNRYGVFYKVAGAAEGASYDFTTGDSGEAVAGIIITVKDANTSTPIDTHSTNTGDSGTHFTPSLSADAGQLSIVATFCEGGGTHSIDTLQSLIASNNNGFGNGGASLAVASYQNANASTTNSGVFTGVDNQWLTIHILVNGN